MNKKLMESMGFREACHSVNVGRCPFCQQVINLADFTDELSRKECTISGLCQDCQDAFFKERMTEVNSEN